MCISHEGESHFFPYWRHFLSVAGTGKVADAELQYYENNEKKINFGLFTTEQFGSVIRKGFPFLN